MNLTVRIHDIEYVNKIAQGATFSEEYNETLEAYGRPLLYRYFACPLCAGAFEEWEGEEDAEF